MGNGTYTDKDGNRVTVRKTDKGYLLRYADGRTVSIKA